MNSAWFCPVCEKVEGLCECCEEREDDDVKNNGPLTQMEEYLPHKQEAPGS